MFICVMGFSRLKTEYLSYDWFMSILNHLLKLDGFTRSSFIHPFSIHPTLTFTLYTDDSDFSKGESSFLKPIYPSRRVIHPSKKVNGRTKGVIHPSKGEWSFVEIQFSQKFIAQHFLESIAKKLNTMNRYNRYSRFLF